MAESQRRTLFVDTKVQGAVVKRLFVYWLFCALFITVPQLIGQMIAEPDQLFVQQLRSVWQHHWLVLTAMIVLLPFLLWDALKVSNKFAGPMFRLRRELRRYLGGDDFQHVRFREGDFWTDLAAQINHLVTGLEAAEKQLADQAASDLDAPAEPVPSQV